MVFPTSIFLETDGSYSSERVASMVSNVSVAYNASDPAQRNAVYQAQNKIAKAQKRKIDADNRKQKYGLKTEDSNMSYSSLSEFSSIFLEDFPEKEV